MKDQTNQLSREEKAGLRRLREQLKSKQQEQSADGKVQEAIEASMENESA